jgi:protease I
MTDTPNDTYKASELPANATISVLIVTADDTQDLEFFYPYYRFVEAGFHVDVATPDGGEFKGKMGMGLKETLAIEDVSSSQYQLLYIPGGKAPEKLKKNEGALTIVRDFVAAKKPVAAICHGAQVLAAAGVIQGRNIAAWPDVQKEVEEAGATFVSRASVTDGQFITARWPGDLPSHVKAVLQQLNHAGAEQKPRLAS